MGVSIAVTRAAANTSTGTQDITSDDLGGLTPKAVLLIATRGVTDGTAADGAGMYWGASDGTNEWAQSYESQHAQASMNMQMTQDANADRILTIHDGTAASTVDATADFDSFIANGVRIDWTDAPASAFLITAVFFAGTDLSAQVGNQDLGTTPDDLIAITSVGFEADVLITTVLRTLTQGGPSFGFVHNNRAGTVVQRGIGHKQRDGFGSSSVAVMMREDSCFMQMLSTDSLDWFGTAQSFDTDGFDIQLGNSRGASGSDVGWIALRFGTSPVVSSKVYTYSTPTGTGANTDSTPDFEPQFAMYLANRAAAADTLETDADGGTIGVVMVDADDLYTQSISDEDAAADSNTQSLSDNILNLPTHTGASGHEATLTSMGSTGPVWSYSATNGTARLWAALAIGVFEEAGGEEYNQSAAGTATPTGALVRRTSKVAAGSLTPAGEITTTRGYTRSFDGTLAGSGSVARTAGKVAGGSITPTGALVRVVSKIFAGEITPTGALESVRTFLKSITGAITPTGTTSRATSRNNLAGTLTPSGATAKTAAKVTAGTLIPSGALRKQAGKALAGVLTPTGAMVRQARKALAGSLNPSGVIARSISKTLSGALTPSGSVSKAITRALAGSLSIAGTLIAALGGDPDQQPTAHIFKITRRIINASGRKDVRVKRENIQPDPHKGD